MPDTLLTKWLKHYDPLHRGWTPEGIANGVCATNGFAFPRIQGGYNLYRSTSRQSGPQGPIVGAAGHDASTIRLFEFVTHAPSTTYYYWLCAVGGGGIENRTNEVVVEAIFDATGQWLGAHPNPPTDLRVSPLSGGRFLLKWTYSSPSELIEPAEFRIYHDAGTGIINYASPAGVVAYHRGRVHFEYTSTAFPHGQRIRWSVRAVTATNVEELNQQHAAAWAQAQAPPTNPTVLITVQDA